MRLETVARLAVRTPTLAPATHTNAYRIGTREFVLVEPATPYEEEIAQLFAWVDEAISHGGELRAILLTHHHVDHVGATAAAIARYRVPLWAHRETAARIDHVAKVDRFLDDGDVIPLDGPEPTEVRAVYTPGHAPGHLCYLDAASGDLLAGDMVASEGTILIEPGDGDMQRYLDSLEAMKRIGPVRLLPAHGGPIDAPTAKLDAYIAHRGVRESKVLEALATLGSAGDGASLDELVTLAYADTPSAIWPIAKLSLEAHLIKLEREGRAEQPSPGAWRRT